MSVTLTSRQLSRLRGLVEALVSPLRHPDARSWAEAVGEAATALMEADGAIVVLPEEEGGVGLHHVGGDRESEEVLEACLAGTGPGVLRFRDPALERMLHRVGAAGVRVWTTELAERLSRVRREDTRFYHEVARPLGIVHQVNAAVALPEGQGLLALYHERPDRDPFGEERIPLMQALRPAFRAGLTALREFRERRRSVKALLGGRTRTGVSVVDLQGRVCYRNAAFRRMLERDPERARILGEVEALSDSVRELRLAETKSAPSGPSPVLDDRVLSTDSGVYRLGASLLPRGLIRREEAVMVTVRCDACFLPTEESLGEVYDLTPRQAQVALLVARGLGTRAVAERLSISPHTVRRHVERVFSKMDVHARGEILPRLLANAEVG